MDILIDFASQYYRPDEVAQLKAAADFATQAHDGQERASGEPYISHPLGVAHTLAEWKMDIDTVIAGVLHDTVEDTTATIEAIESLFGKDVARLVDGVTKVNQARSGMKDIGEYLPATRDNLSKLLIAVGDDVRVIIIKLADRLHNLQTLEHLSPVKQKKIAHESLTVFAPMADRLGMFRVRMQIEDLAFRFDQPDQYRKLNKIMKDRLAKSHRRLLSVQKETEDALKKAGIAFTMSGRVKSIYSVYKKLRKVDGNLDELFDLIALRVIVENKDDCYRVLGLIHSLYQPMVDRIKDYIATPKPNGYQSLHTTVITPSKQIVEFQIRSREMHEYAERGLAASFHYNEQKLSKNYERGGASMLPAHLNWINELQEIASNLSKGASVDDLSLDLFADRIFVYSPKGDIYNLPEGALPLDFAYLVHSDIGAHAYGAIVNGKPRPFDKPLLNGDIVEIVTKKTSRPKASWMNLVKSAHSRGKLKAQLNKLGD
jgi:guanosine-3',5'-bis(diphosphate) 3'-pyrophosphohydrolase